MPYPTREQVRRVAEGVAREVGGSVAHHYRAGEKPEIEAKPTSLASLKRYLAPGMKLRRVHTRDGVATVFEVKRARPSAFTILLADGKESWHHYEKASAYTFTESSFTCDLGARVGSVTYTYVEP